MLVCRLNAAATASFLFRGELGQPAGKFRSDLVPLVRLRFLPDSNLGDGPTAPAAPPGSSIQLAHVDARRLFVLHLSGIQSSGERVHGPATSIREW